MKARRLVSRGCVRRTELRQCQLGRAASHSAELQCLNRIIDAIDGYACGIVKVVGECYGSDSVQHAWAEFNIGAARTFQAHDPNAELFFSWLFHQWSPERKTGIRLLDKSLYGVRPTRAFLDRTAPGVDPLLKRYLETCLVTSPRFYEIDSCNPRVGFQVRDVLTGAASQVCEGLASRSLKQGEIIFAHLIPIDGITMLDAISPRSFPPTMKRSLIRLNEARGSGKHIARKLRELYFTMAHAPYSIPA